MPRVPTPLRGMGNGAAGQGEQAPPWTPWEEDAMQDREETYPIRTRAMGVYYRRRDGAEFTVRVGDALEARRDPTNPYDCNAIGLHAQDGERIGWVPRDLAANLAPFVDAGRLLSVRVTRVDGTDVSIDLLGGAVEAWHEEDIRKNALASQAYHVRIAAEIRAFTRKKAAARARAARRGLPDPYPEIDADSAGIPY